MMPIVTADLSIIIVNWNSRQDILKCLASIYRAPTTEFRLEVTIVDNGSSDGSCEAIAGDFPQTNIIRAGENLGFARANNVGFESSASRFVLFLNPDTEIVGSALPAMMKCLDSHPDIGLLGCKLLNGDRSIQTAAIQRYPRILTELFDSEWLRTRAPRSRFFGMAPLWSNDPGLIAPVEALSGACILGRRSVLKEVGVFSTDYFMYTEDIDLGYKVNRAGWKVCYFNGATVVHYGGQSTKQRDAESFSVVVQRDSIFKFLLKTRGRVYAWTYRVLLLAASLARIAVLRAGRIFHGFGSEKDSWMYSERKWRNVLRWAVGLDPVTRGLSKRAAAKSASVNA